jgi:cytochrome c peroxidase
VFKVPSLRLAALTPPYFHDGSARTLAEAVRVMARYQLGRRLPDGDVDDIVAFLGTLPGEYDGHPLEPAQDR